MDIKWLEDLLCLAKTKNFSRSAETRNITQSAFSRRIQSLEAWAGAELIDRNTYPLCLTPAGEECCEFGEHLLHQLYELREHLQSDKSRIHMLQIASGYSLSLYFIPALLKRVQLMHVGIKAHIVACNIYDSAAGLVDGNFDAVICYYHPDRPIRLSLSQCDYITLGAEVLVPVSVPSASGQPVFALMEGGGPVPAIGHGTNYFTYVMKSFFLKKSSQVHLDYCYHSNMSEVVKKMALDGYGVAWLPRRLVVHELENGDFVLAGGKEWEVPLEIRYYYRIDNKKSDLIELSAILKSEYGMI